MINYYYGSRPNFDLTFEVVLIPAWDMSVPMILEEASIESGDKLNTCRACAGSPFC